jgi:hypothetical protein
MHSVVIHIKKKPQEWHLVESLFYKVQANKQLLFLEFLEYENWDQVYKQVQTYILQNRFEHWQLILLNNNELNQENLNSLTREIHLIKDKLLKRLSEKGIAPSRRILLTLDGVKRNADYSPIIEKNHYQWQMDNFGYINHEFTLGGNYGNVFLEKEIHSIDEEWGGRVNLKDAGIMDNPTEKFLEELNQKSEKVQQSLQTLICAKKRMVEQNYLIKYQLYYELHTTEELNTIYEEFCQQLEEMCSPPFSYHLSTFLPSNLLKTILKENIGVPSVIGDFLLIRKAISEYSPFQKIRALMGYAFLLNAIVLKPEVIDRVGNGLSFEVEVVLREEEIREMYSNYYVCLQVAKEKIENRNMGQDHFMVNKFAEINALPYSTDPLDEMGINSPEFKFKNRRTYLHDWKHYLEDIEISFQNRELLSLDSAKDGIKVLALTKRQKVDHFLQELVNINEYSQSIRKSKNQIQSELSEAAPSLSAARLKWKRSYPKYKKRMELLVKSLPTQNILITSSIIAFISIIIPYLSNTTELPIQNSNFLRYFLIPAVLIGFISCICFISYKRLLKPIILLTEEAQSLKKALSDEQMVSHSKYNDYLNNIYKLFRLRNQFRELEGKSVLQKEENVLYRWHQGEINNHITLLNQLMAALDISIHYDNKDKCLTYFNTIFDVNKNVYKNPIYSPLDCQFDKGKNGHSMDVYVENSRDEITTWSLNPIEKIRFSQDKVYLL